MTTTPTKYRKKPVVIEAMQYTLPPAEAVAVYQWVESNTLGSFDPVILLDPEATRPASGVTIDPSDGLMVIATLAGWMKVSLDDWVIRGVDGEFYPCKPDIFAATYDAVEAPHA